MGFPSSHPKRSATSSGSSELTIARFAQPWLFRETWTACREIAAALDAGRIPAKSSAAANEASR
jgi:hypothetical protein